MSYSKPPIQEALLDFQVNTPGIPSLSSLQSFHLGLEARFPNQKMRVSIEQGLQLASDGEGESSSVKRTVDGYQWWAPDQSKIVQARQDGFTFNKLRPYEGWDCFRQEAMELWVKYVSLIKPLEIRRIGLRYINRFDLPLPLNDLRDYCRLFPDLPAALPQGLAEFLLRFVVPEPTMPGVSAVVTLAFQPLPSGATILPLILDIDAFQNMSLAIDQGEALSTTLSGLRTLKNRIFESCITDATRQLFQ